MRILFYQPRMYSRGLDTLEDIMNKGVIVLLLVFMIVGLVLYHKYFEESVDDFGNDIQAYQSRSLLPEDN